MGTINFDELPAAVARKTEVNTGAKFKVEDVAERIRTDVEKLLRENETLVTQNKRPKYVVQECGSKEAAQAWLKQMDKWRKYRPDGQITIRVPNRKDVEDGKATAVTYAAKPLETREPTK